MIFPQEQTRPVRNLIKFNQYFVTFWFECLFFILLIAFVLSTRNIRTKFWVKKIKKKLIFWILNAIMFTRPYEPNFLYQTDMLNDDFATVALLKPFFYWKGYYYGSLTDLIAYYIAIYLMFWEKWRYPSQPFSHYNRSSYYSNQVMYVGWKVKISKGLFQSNVQVNKSVSAILNLWVYKKSFNFPGY